MEVDLIFRIAAIGIIVAVLHQLLTHAKREDIAMLVTIAGVVVVLMMVIPAINDVFETVRSVFGLY